MQLYPLEHSKGQVDSSVLILLMRETNDQGDKSDFRKESILDCTTAQNTRRLRVEGTVSYHLKGDEHKACATRVSKYKTEWEGAKGG